MKDNPKFNTDFVQLVEKHPVIFDNTLTDYNNRQAVDAAWKEIAYEVKEMFEEEVTVDECKNRWKGLRSSFTRYRNRRQSDDVRPYYLFEALKFLMPFTKSRLHPESSNNYSEDSYFDDEEMDQTGNIIKFSQNFLNVKQELVTNAQDEDEYANGIADMKHDVENVSSHRNNVLEPEAIISENDFNYFVTRKSKKRKQNLEEQLTIIKDLETKLQSLNDNRIADMDFFKSILIDIKDFTAIQKRKFKIRILQLIDEIQTDI